MRRCQAPSRRSPAPATCSWNRSFWAAAVPAISIGIGNGTGTLVITQATLNAVGGNVKLTIGYPAGSNSFDVVGPVSFPVATALTSSNANFGGPVVFDGAISAPALAVAVDGAVTVQPTGALTIGTPSSSIQASAGEPVGSVTSGVGGINLFSFYGPLAVSGSITTSGGPVTLQTSGYGGPITLAGSIGSNGGTVTLNTAGSITQSGRVATNGGSATYTSGGTITTTVAATIALGTGATLTFNTDAIALNGAGSITGTASAVQIFPLTPATTIGIGTGTGTLSISQTTINAISGPTLNIGQLITQTGLVTLGGTVSFPAGVTSIAANGSGSSGIALAADAAVSLPAGNLLLLTAGTSSISEQQGATIALQGSGAILDLVANTLSLTPLSGGAASITGSGTVNVFAPSPATAIGIGTGAGTLSIGPSTLNAFGGALDLAIGQNSAQTGQISLAGPVTFPVATTLYANGTNGSIAIGAAAAVAANGSLTLDAGVDGNITEANGATVFVGDNAALTFVTNTIALNSAGSITSNGPFCCGTSATIEPISGASTIAIGSTNASASTLSVSPATLSAFANITVGVGVSGQQTGAVTIEGALALPSSIPLYVNTAGSVTFAASAAVTAPSSGFVALFAGSIAESQGATVSLPATGSFLGLYSDNTSLIPLAGGAPSITGTGTVFFAGTSIAIGSGAGALSISQTTINAVNAHVFFSAGGSIAVGGALTFPALSTVITAGNDNTGGGVTIGASAAITVPGGTTLTFETQTGGAVTEVQGATVAVASGASLEFRD